jgi:hypothetical protein
MNEPNLSDFVAFGAGIAGFASIVVALGQREGRLSEYDRFRVVQLFMCALITAFIALLQGTLASFGIRGENAYRVASAVLMIAIGADACLAMIMARRMSMPASSSLSPTMWHIGPGLGVVLFAWNGLNLAAWPRPTSFGRCAAITAIATLGDPRVALHDRRTLSQRCSSSSLSAPQGARSHGTRRPNVCVELGGCESSQMLSSHGNVRSRASRGVDAKLERPGRV